MWHASIETKSGRSRRTWNPCTVNSTPSSSITAEANGTLGVHSVNAGGVAITTSVKSAAAYSIGVSTITMNSFPAGSSGVVPVAGVCSNITFTPALTSGAALTITHNTDTVISATDTIEPND